MRSTMRAVVSFTIYHSKQENPFVDGCEKIMRETEQNIEIEIPQEVVSLLQNLTWSGTLALVVSLEGKNTVNLLDKESSARKQIVSDKGSREHKSSRLGKWWFRF